jgi:hypothetical protein
LALFKVDVVSLGNKIHRMTGLKRLERLTKLELRNNALKSTADIGYATSLKELYLVFTSSYSDLTCQSNNQISQLKDFDLLKNLEILHLRNNHLVTVEGLENLPALGYLNLR